MRASSCTPHRRLTRTLVRHLEERLNASIEHFSVLEIDYGRETTRFELRHVPVPRTPPTAKETLDATVAIPDC